MPAPENFFRPILQCFQIVSQNDQCASENFRQVFDTHGFRTYRWLLEVFFSDWKCYEGWGQAAMQRDETGSLCGVTLSLLLDQCLLLHPEQIRRIKANKPACTVGSLLEKIRLDDHLDSVRRLLDNDDPWKELEKYAARMQSVIVLRDSKKHLTGRTMEPLTPRISLAAKFKHAS